MQLSLPGVPILMCFFLRCTKPATSTAVAQAPRVFSCWRNAFGCMRCLEMARPFDEQCCCPFPVMRPSVNESVQSASQASLQKQCFCLCAGNADFLANDIRCKKGLDGLGCLGEPAAWPTCPCTAVVSQKQEPVCCWQPASNAQACAISWNAAFICLQETWAGTASGHHCGHTDSTSRCQ